MNDSNGSGVRIVAGNQLAGTRLGPAPAPRAATTSSRLEGCLLAVVAEGGRALASDTSIDGEEHQLVLEVAGTRVAGWPWSEVISMNADAIAEDPEGRWVQLLEISTADHTFRFLATAEKISTWLSNLPPEGTDCFAGLKDAYAHVETENQATTLARALVGAPVDGGYEPRVQNEETESAQPNTDGERGGNRTLPDYEHDLGEPVAAGDRGPAGPADMGRVSTEIANKSANNGADDRSRVIGTARTRYAQPPGIVGATTGALGSAHTGDTEADQIMGPPGPGPFQGSTSGTAPSGQGRSARHAKRRLFGRSSRADNRHAANEVEMTEDKPPADNEHAARRDDVTEMVASRDLPSGTETVRRTDEEASGLHVVRQPKLQVVRNLLTWDRGSAAHARPARPAPALVTRTEHASVRHGAHRTVYGRRLHRVRGSVAGSLASAALAISAGAASVSGRHGLHAAAVRRSPRRRIVSIGIAVLVAGLLVAGTAEAFAPGAADRSSKGPVVADAPETQNIVNALAPPKMSSFRLAPARSKPKPAPALLTSMPSLQSHEVFAFAPYWTLADASEFELNELTTVDYFGVDVNGNGSIEHSGDGWTGYESQDLADLITAAHTAGDRMVLTAECFNQATLNELTSDPAAGTTLGDQLVQLVEAKNFDGVNIDFEGSGSEDQAGLDRLMAKVSSIVRAADSHYQVTMDTYASSAGDPSGFYDIKGLASSVDAFFVMAYQMGGPQASANGEFVNSNFSATATMQEYTEVVPASKVILGLPYYGEDWPTTGPAANARATGAPTPVADSALLGTTQPVYWNEASGTAWTAYKTGKQWHQEWFEDPNSLALKAQIAGDFHARGVGIWTLGMDGNDPAMLAALVGGSPVVKSYSPSPSTTSSSTTTTTTARSTTTTRASTTTSTTDRSTTSTTAPSTTTSTTHPTTTTTTAPSTTTTVPPTTVPPTTEPPTSPSATSP